MRKLHMGLVQQPVALPQVAGRTRGDDVLPDGSAAARTRNHVVKGQPAARRAAVDTTPAVTGKQRTPGDLPLNDARNSNVAQEPYDVRPRKPRRGRAKWSVEFFDHLRLPLIDEDVRAAQRAHIQRLKTGVQYQYLLHFAEKVPNSAVRPETRDVGTRSCSTESAVVRAETPSAEFESASERTTCSIARSVKQRLTAHGSFHRLLLFGGKRYSWAAAVDFLHVDARVIPALDGGDDDA